MASRVEMAVRKAVGRLIPRNAAVLAAVSGGPDSITLLHLLNRISAGYPLDLSVGHLDHGLRRGSAGDLRFVKEVAASLGLPCFTDFRPVAVMRKKSESPEEAARRVRRQFLLDAMDRAGAVLVATGHTLDDQAETVLMRILRGAGPASLAGIRESGPGPFVRPLLGLRRIDLQGWLESRSLESREDPTNRSLRFDRNRVRLKVMPFLEARVNPAASTHLVQAASLLAEDADYLNRMAEERYCSLRSGRSGAVRLAAGALAALPEVLARRVAVLAFRDAGLPERRISRRLIQALLDLDRGGSGRKLHLAGNVLAARTRLYLNLTREQGDRR